MEAADSFDRSLRELGTCLKSEEAQVAVAFPEYREAAGEFYLSLWHLSNSLSVVFRLATGEPRDEHNVKNVATAIIRFVEHFKNAIQGVVVVDMPRAIHAPDGVVFMSHHVPAFSDALLDLAHNVMRTLAAIDDSEECDRAWHDCANHPRGELHYNFSPVAVAEKWPDYRGNVVKFILCWLQSGIHYENELPPEWYTAGQQVATVPEIVELKDVGKMIERDSQTVRNKLRKDLPNPVSPKKGSVGATYRYSELRPILVKHWPNLAHRLP